VKRDRLVGCLRVSLAIGMALSAVACSESASRDTGVKLPSSDDFSGDCQWPQGENSGKFSYGCDHDRYEMTMAGAGVQGYHVTQDFDFHSRGLSAEVTETVQRGAGVEKGMLFGVGCLKDDQHGYVAAYANYNHRVGIARLEDDFTWIANKQMTASPPSGPSVRLGDICVNLSTGYTLVAATVNGKVIGSAVDKTLPGFETYDGVFLYANTWPGLATFDDLTMARPAHRDIQIARSLVSE